MSLYTCVALLSQVVERQKEGYESDVEDIDEGIGNEDDDFDSDDQAHASDSDE